MCRSVDLVWTWEKKKPVLLLKQYIIKGYQFLNHFSVMINNKLIIHMLTSARECQLQIIRASTYRCPGLSAGTPTDSLVKFIPKLRWKSITLCSKSTDKPVLDSQEFWKSHSAGQQGSILSWNFIVLVVQVELPLFKSLPGSQKCFFILTHEGFNLCFYDF